MNNENKKDHFDESGLGLAHKSKDSFMDVLRKIIRVAVRALAVLMVVLLSGVSVMSFMFCISVSWSLHLCF